MDKTERVEHVDALSMILPSDRRASDDHAFGDLEQVRLIPAHDKVLAFGH